jgi:phage gpG-like protein
MSGVIINVKIDDMGVKAMLSRLQANVGDLKPVMKTIGGIVRSSVIQNFREGGRPNKWTPTKAISNRISFAMGGRNIEGDEQRSGLRIRKGKKVYKLDGEKTRAYDKYSANKKTLIDTARLMKSITYKEYSNRVEIGTNVVYGAIHQLGGKAGRGRKVTIPARPYLMVQDSDWTTIGEVVTRHLMKGVRQ